MFADIIRICRGSAETCRHDFRSSAETMPNDDLHSAAAVDPIQTRQVWAENLEAELRMISDLIDIYHFVAMDTEFPGVVYKPPHSASRCPRRASPVENYRILKSNVDILSMIQLGITLSDDDGNLPELVSGERCIWQFNFSNFDVARDPHALDSIELLQAQGIDFEQNRLLGIDSARFAEAVMGSGLVCNDGVCWVTFHSAYDFGYLVKVITRRPLPASLGEFTAVLRALFGGKVYDVKHLMRFCESLHGGLDRVARTLNVERVVGKTHQAGSDSLVTWHAFRKMRELYFVEEGVENYVGVLYGLELEGY